jgi:hypothetical protein
MEAKQQRQGNYVQVHIILRNVVDDPIVWFVGGGWLCYLQLSIR